jgi:hypothetical protein
VIGNLDNPQTRTIYGNQRVLTDAIDGLRVRAGLWFDPCATCGIDFGGFNFGTNGQNFAATSGGNPGLFRPFFNTTTGAQDVQIVALQLPRAGGGFDPILTGSVGVGTTTDFYGWDANFRKRLCGDDCARLDLLVGYRYMHLQDATTIEENLLGTDPLERALPLGARILLVDRFETINSFNGGQLGLAGERSWGRWSAGLRTLVALGDTHQTVQINGVSQFITAQGSSTAVGGLLAQPSNIGSFGSDHFSVISEIAGNIGYQITPRVRVFGGYTWIYWSSVARSGNQIDFAVNPSQLPQSQIPSAGPNRPAFQLRDTDFWAHGYNVGVQVSW